MHDARAHAGVGRLTVQVTLTTAVVSYLTEIEAYRRVPWRIPSAVTLFPVQFALSGGGPSPMA